LGEVASKIGKKKGENQQPDATLLNHCVRFRPSPARPVARRWFSWTSDWTLDRTRRCDHCVRSQTSSARPIARSGFSGGPLTGLCPCPVTSNRTHSVAQGAYWTLTGRLCSVSGHPVKSESESFSPFHRRFPFFLLHHCVPPLP
jgi:hypothetical protein